VNAKACYSSDGVRKTTAAKEMHQGVHALGLVGVKVPELRNVKSPYQKSDRKILTMVASGRLVAGCRLWLRLREGNRIGSRTKNTG
jgi:hypothetical protein